MTQTFIVTSNLLTLVNNTCFFYPPFFFFRFSVFQNFQNLDLFFYFLLLIQRNVTSETARQTLIRSHCEQLLQSTESHLTASWRVERDGRDPRQNRKAKYFLKQWIHVSKVLW